MPAIKKGIIDPRQGIARVYQHKVGDIHGRNRQAPGKCSGGDVDILSAPQSLQAGINRQNPADFAYIRVGFYKGYARAF